MGPTPGGRGGGVIHHVSPVQVGRGVRAETV